MSATTVTSTVPGAIETLFGHCQAVAAAADTALDCRAYLGTPIENPAFNFVMVGNALTNEMLVGYRMEIATYPAQANYKEENYGIPCSIRSWAGNSTPVARLNEALSLADGVLGALQADLTASGSITTSGVWFVPEITMPQTGPMTGEGWGVLLQFVVQVVGAVITS